MTRPHEAIVYDVQRFSIHDGPGIRTTVFFKACALACAWCQNPEALHAAPELTYDAERCLEGCTRCLDACSDDALRPQRTGRVDFSRCTGCGACIDVCPRGIISRVPFKASEILVVKCSNDDFGLEVKKVCQVGCIGCKACTKFSDLLVMEGNLPIVDYQADGFLEADFATSLDKCPAESLVYVGIPSAADIAATADEELPERIEPEFETTVDRADWWG